MLPIEFFAAPGVGLALLLANVASTLYLAGVIWTVQLVHYALFDRVGAGSWAVYHAAHMRLMTFVVLAPMVLELGTSGLLALTGVPGVPRSLLWAGLAFASLTWAATFFISVPLHKTLAHGFDAPSVRALVATNWWRTALWSGHALMVLEILRRLLILRHG